MKAKYELDEIVLVPMRVSSMSIHEGRVMYELVVSKQNDLVEPTQKVSGGFTDLVAGAGYYGASKYQKQEISLYEEQIAETNK